MRAKAKVKTLIWLACVFSRFAGCKGFVFAKQKVTLTPMDPAVCISQNITFTCNVNHKSDSKAQIGILLNMKPVKENKENNVYYNQKNKSTVELTLYNVSRNNSFLAVCCSLSMNMAKCEAGPSILNVNSPVTKLHNGTLNPIDPNVCLTQNITFTCTLRSPPVSANSIGFAIKNESTNTEFVAVENKEIYIVNESVSEFTIHNINASVDSYIHVRCFYWETHGHLDESLKIGDTSMAKVSSMPMKIEKIDCIVENYLWSMTCTWDYGTSRKPFNVFFKWRIPHYSATWNDCPDLNSDQGYCYWNSSRAGDFTMKVIEINITVGELCGVEIPSNFTIDTSQIVKPNPVVKLQANVLNSTCIEVSWGTNNSEMQYPKDHRLVVSSKWNDEKTFKFITTPKFENISNKTVCHLRPYTEYTFKVQIQPTGDQAGFYSEPRVTRAKTFSDLPDASPEVTKGGYSWNQRECEEKNQRREVCVFWKLIKMEDKNGPMKGLKGFFTADNNRKGVIDEDWAEDSTHGCSSLFCDTSYTFTIQARNVNGTSKYNSTLKISSAFSGIPQPHFIVESANTSDVYVNWTFPEDGNLDRFIVAWCRKRNGECEKIHEVFWEYYPADSREAILAINSTNSAQDFLYGVGALTKQGSSGLEWQGCVYLKNIAPKNPPKNVVVSEGSEDNTLVVTWDKLTCTTGEPYIAMYNIQYNKLDDTNKKSLNVRSFGEARVVLADLEEDQTYVVTVRGIAKDGQSGPMSPPETGTPVNKSLTPAEIGGIAMGVLVAAIFAGVGCFCMIRIFKNKAKMKFEKDRKITIPGNDLKPTIPETNELTPDRISAKSIDRQNSDDSGIFPMTPPPDKFSEDSPKFDKPAIRALPDDDYVIATEGSFINCVPRHCTVGMVMQGNIMPSPETFVKKVDKQAGKDETSVKLRGKNISGDSGMSDTYSQATVAKFGENIPGKIDDDADANNIKIESALSNNKIPEYVAATCAVNTIVEQSNNTDFFTDESLSLNQTKIHNYIPKPDAFIEHSDSELSPSETSSNYTRAQWPTQSNAETINCPSHVSNMHPEFKRSSKTDCPVLTKIPSPVIDRDYSSDEHKENVFQNSEIENDHSADMIESLDNATQAPSSFIKNSNSVGFTVGGIPVSHIPASVQNSSVLQEKSDYVTATADNPNRFYRAQVSPILQQTSSNTGYFSPASTSASETNVGQSHQSFIPLIHSHSDSFSQPENQPSDQISNISSDYVTSVSAPSISKTAASLCSSVSTASQYDGNTQPTDVEDHVLARMPSSSTASDGYLQHQVAGQVSFPATLQCTAMVSDSFPAQCYMPHTSLIQGCPNSAANENKAFISPNDPLRSIPVSNSGSYVSHSCADQNLLHLSDTDESDPVPTTLFQDNSDYERSPDFPTRSSSQSDQNGGIKRQTDYIPSDRLNECNMSAGFGVVDNGYMDQSVLHNHSSTPMSSSSTISQDQSQFENVTGEQTPNQGYVDETFALNHQAEFEQTTDDTETNKQTGGTGEIQQANGYVAHSILANVINEEQLHSHHKEPLAFEMKDVSEQENIGEDEEEIRSKSDSDSGLSSLESGESRDGKEAV